MGSLLQKRELKQSRADDYARSSVVRSVLTSNCMMGRPVATYHELAEVDCFRDFRARPDDGGKTEQQDTKSNEEDAVCLK